jgi:hypothetical protein
MTVSERIRKIAAESIRLGVPPAHCPSFTPACRLGRTSGQIWDAIAELRAGKPADPERDEPDDDDDDRDEACSCDCEACAAGDCRKCSDPSCEDGACRRAGCPHQAEEGDDADDADEIEEA